LLKKVFFFVQKNGEHLFMRRHFLIFCSENRLKNGEDLFFENSFFVQNIETIIAIGTKNAIQ